MHHNYLEIDNTFNNNYNNYYYIKFNKQRIGFVAFISWFRPYRVKITHNYFFFPVQTKALPPYSSVSSATYFYVF